MAQPLFRRKDQREWKEDQLRAMQRQGSYETR